MAAPDRPTPPPNRGFLNELFPVNPLEVAGGLYGLSTQAAGNAASYAASHSPLDFLAPGSATNPGVQSSAGQFGQDVTAMLDSPAHGHITPSMAAVPIVAAGAKFLPETKGAATVAETLAQRAAAPRITSIQSAEQAIKNSPDLMHRGMSEAEYQQMLQSGVIQSKGIGNVGANEGGMTFFSGDPRVAASYAHLQGSPTYVVSVKRPDSSLLGIDRQSGFELGANSPINADDITAVYRGEKGPGGQYQWSSVDSEPPSPTGASIANALYPQD